MPEDILTTASPRPGGPPPGPAPGVPAAPVAPAVQGAQIWICPGNGQPVCAENLATTTSTPEDPLAEMLAWCASRSANAQAVAEGMVSVSVVVMSMELTVEDPQAFVNNPSSKRAVEEGIAQAVGAGVVADDVEVTLSPVRRLAEIRALQGVVAVEATIRTENAAAAASLKQSVDGLSEAAMATSLNTALEAAGVDAGVTVNAMSAEATTIQEVSNEEEDTNVSCAGPVVHLGMGFVGLMFSGLLF